MSLARGFKLRAAGIDQIVASMGDNYADHDYRYMKPNATLRYVSDDGLIPVIQNFIDEVAVDIGLPERPRGVAA